MMESSIHTRNTKNLISLPSSSLLNTDFNSEAYLKQNVAHPRENESYFFKNLLLLEVNGFTITH